MSFGVRFREFLLLTCAVAVDILLLLFAANAESLRNTPFAGVVVTFFVAACAIGPVATVWMSYQAIRYEKRPWIYVLLAFFVPYAFVWYYFSRVRGRSPADRRRDLFSRSGPTAGAPQHRQ